MPVNLTRSTREIVSVALGHRRPKATRGSATARVAGREGSHRVGTGLPGAGTGERVALADGILRLWLAWR